MSKENYSKVIKSSEISMYVYCPYSWWESRTKGVIETKEMAAGSLFHEGYMVKQGVARKLNYVGYVILAVVIILVMYYFLS